MILTNDIKEIVFALANKQGHGTISPDEFSKYAQMANLDEYQEYTSGIETYYQMGKAMAKVAPGMNKIMNQKLLPFLVTEETMTKTGDVFLVPAGAEFIDYVLAGTKQAKWVPGHMLSRYLESTIDEPSTSYPIYADTATGIQIYPSTVTVGKLTYLKAPATVVWGYTLNGRLPVYSAGSTVNFEWGQGHKMSLITKILSYIGIGIRDGDLRNMAMTEEQKSSK